MEADTSRARLLGAIDARRRGIGHYLATTRPVNRRLTTISIVSSCLAAALAAGPAVGGADLAETVRNGLGLGQSEGVWRLLCLAAVVASVTAAISANLSRSSDLTARIAAVEAANSLLEGLRTRVRFSRLPVADAAQQYQEIITRVPWVSEVLDVPSGGSAADDDEESPDGSDRLRPTTRPATYLIGTAVFAASFALVAVVGLVAGLVRAAPASAAPGTAAPATPPPTSVVAPSSATPTVEPVAFDVYSGATSGGTTLAVVIDGGRVSAYLCDGAAVEAWFDGSVTDGRIELTGRNGAAITATVRDGSLVGTTSVGGTVEFSIPLAREPAGVYESRVVLDGVEVRLGWAVLADGRQTGVQNRGGQRSAAPTLTFPEATFEFAGATRAAERISGAADVVG